MSQFQNNMIRESSVPLDGGGDSHFHPWSSGTGFDVTTRLPGGFVDHEHIRINRLLSEPEHPEVLQHLPNP